MKHIVIVGNGVSGITAARHIRKRSDDRITVISGETDHFFSRTALMYIYMGHQQYAHTKPYEDYFWKKNRIDLVRAWVAHVETGTKQVELDSGQRIGYDVLLIATGSKSNFFGWPGQELQGVQGLYSYQDLEQMEVSTKGIERAVVVGGGLIGVEMAEMLHSRGIHVTFLVREQQFWGNILPKGEADLIGRHIRQQGIDLRLGEELKELIGENGKVNSATTVKGEKLPAQFVGITVGVSPNVAWLKDSGIATDRGVLVNKYFETNVPDVYAIGDCAQFHEHPDPDRRNIEQVWYTGRMMGETVARTVCGERTAYGPGPWFNSAKFFDIEYHTYGWVRAQQRESEDGFYWEHEDGRICCRIVWDKSSRRFVGINAFGFRLRHEVFDRWLRGAATVDHVVEHMAEAHFDPEFGRMFERAIQRSFTTTAQHTTP